MQECKRTLKAAWSSMSDHSDDEGDTLDAPSNFKKYTIQDRKIFLQQPIRQKPEEPGISYDGPEDAKQIDLAEPGEEPRQVWIAIDLTPEEESLLISTLKDYRDVLLGVIKT